MSKIVGGAAFPTHEFHHSQMLPVGGMTLRDYVAIKAMQGMCTGIFPDLNERASIVQRAYAMADEMLKARAS
jgi:hypothetical protein